MRWGAVVVAVVLLCAPMSVGASAPATFKVGVAVADVGPPDGVDVYSGGFGQSPPLYRRNQSEPHNTLNARAIYIASATHAIATVTVDSQGIFAAVQEANQGTSGLGSAGMRIDGARAIAARHLGPAMTDADIIVQGTHSHSAPTSMGIWGPVRERYLKLVHDRVVEALVAAAARAVPARLRYATIDAPYLDNINTNQTDSYQGWKQDGQLSILQAIGLNGATVATYANVPAHPDIVDGADLKVLTADYFGNVRYRIEQLLGGTSIVGGATLGREESPVQGKGIAEMHSYGLIVTELLLRSLTHARWITDGTVNSAQQFMFVPVTNPLLAGLNYAWKLPDGVRQQLCDPAACPLNRSLSPPYAVGAFLGTPVTALRVGPLAYVSLNGEAFPEVRHAIAGATHDATVIGLSLGNDQLGYYEPAFAWAFANGEVPYHSDHLEYNASPILGDELIHYQVTNLRRLGFSTDLIPVPKPEDNDYSQMLNPGVQLLASPFEFDAGSNGVGVAHLEGICGDAALYNALGQPHRVSQPIHVAFGDGTTALKKCDGRLTGYFTHNYQPGTYHVTLSLTDDSGATTTWPTEPRFATIVVHPHLSALVTAATSGATTTYTAQTSGGAPILRYLWRFSDGSIAYGRTVRHRSGARPALVVTDATGTTAAA